MKNKLILLIVISLILIGASALPLIKAIKDDISNNSYATLEANGESIKLEKADNPFKQLEGLMNRKEIPENEGMIFIFTDEQPRTFWMKDTLVPLDIIFLDSSLNVVKIYTYTKPNQTSETYNSLLPVKYVIELKGGKSIRLGIEESQTLNVNL